MPDDQNIAQKTEYFFVPFSKSTAILLQPLHDLTSVSGISVYFGDIEPTARGHAIADIQTIYCYIFSKIYTVFPYYITVYLR